MKKFILGLVLCLTGTIAWSQNAGWPPPAGAQAMLGVYNASAQSLTTGQVGWMQIDSAGKLLTSGTTTSSGTSTVGPVGKSTTQAKVTVAVTNTYQQALASSASRSGCTVQYKAVSGTSGLVYFGSAPADTTTSFILTNGQSINCTSGVVVATDTISVTGTVNDIFIVSNQ